MMRAHTGYRLICTHLAWRALKPAITIVVPCYNEEEILASTIPTLLATIDDMVAKNIIDEGKSRLCFVDDGSKDRTWDIIASFSAKYEIVKGLKLSCNKGHQAALLAGLMVSMDDCSATISIDADLQDDPSKIQDMVVFYSQGFEIVYGIRSDRSTDSLTKRILANLFYKLMIFFGVEIVDGHADFRLISQRALRELSKYRESSLFLRGMIPLIGFKSAKIYYPRRKRERGVSKYPFRKSLSLAMDGIFSFSSKPLRYISYISIVFSLISICTLIASIIQFISGSVVPGWTSLIAVITIMGSFQLVSISLLGEYLGRIYKEVKRRPNYHIDERID